MNLHHNARLTPKGRELLVRRLERGERPEDVACAMGVSIRTVYKWRKRFQEEGLAGLYDRSSRATVGRILARNGLSRWRDLDPADPVVRYEHDAPGELIHIDIKAGQVHPDRPEQRMRDRLGVRSCLR